uniref:Cupin domain-containing protein n=1 Tax=Thermorudis peleae TaxID=1382356 RepID=A0A831TG67_9BACT
MEGSVVVPPGKVNIVEKFALFDEYWSPKIIGEINDSYVKAVKVKGEFVWHRHELEDEMFLVVRGSLRMQFRDREIQLGEGEFIIVPRGIEHRPVADEEAYILLFEPKTTLNTGNVRNERTREQLERL